MSSSTRFLSCLVWWIILLLISPFILMFIGLLLFWKFLIIESLAKIILPKGTQILDSFDTTLATDSFWEKPLGCLGFLIVLEGTLDVEQHCKNFKKVILEARGPTDKLIYQKLRVTLREFCGYFFWENVPDFRFEDHVSVVDRLMNESDLKEYTNKSFKSPFTRGRPLWEIHFLTNYQPSSDVPLSVILLKMHHVIADGYTCTKMTDRLTGNISAEYRPSSGTTKALSKQLSMIFTLPSDFMRMCWDGVFDQSWFTQTKKSQDYLISWKTIPLKLFKNARTKTGSRFATIGLGSLAGALQKYATFNTDLEVEGDAHILIPLPWPKHPTDRMANHWTMCIVKVSLTDDAMTRIAKADKELVSLTSSYVPVIVRWAGPYFVSLLPRVFLRPLLGSRTGKGIIYSSVPGPSEVHRIGTNTVRHLIPLTGTQYAQTGIVEFVHTYHESATIIIAANKDICPTSKSVDQICNFVQEELEKLL